MQAKIFTKVFFQKKKFLIAFFSVFSMAIFFLNVQIVVTTSQVQQSAVPDIVIKGKIDDDGTFRYKMYNDIKDFSSNLSKYTVNDATVYGLICRNIMTKNNLFNSIAYSVFGVNDSFFTNELNSLVGTGKIPEKNKNEVLLGSLAARFYKIKVGDKIKIPITLNKDIDENNKTTYVVSGILNDNVEFFKGGIIISKETFEKQNKEVSENMSLIYVKNNNGYTKAYEAVSNIRKNYQIGSTESNYNNNNSVKNSLILNIVIVSIISIIIVLLLLAFLLKGISKKIGLLKSLGISDSYIIRVFVLGLSIVSVISMLGGFIGTYLMKNALNKNVSEFLEYHVEQYKINSYVYLSSIALCILIVAIVFLTITILSRRISPRDAMLKN